MKPELPVAERPRLGNLDYLRGISAICIMIYHYVTWSFGELSARSFLGRVGIYGVAIFYVLSGLTLAYVYQNRISLSLNDLKDFFKKRFFRIFPLLWLATLVSIILSKKLPASTDVLLNLSGLFGFVKWDTYFATGAWSIGNELAFYSVLPILLIALNKNHNIFYLLACTILGCHVLFAFWIINPDKPLSAQWHSYANPLNQLFLFCGGVALHTILCKKNINKYMNLLIGLSGLGVLVFCPSSENVTDLVFGFNRLIFTFSCFLICLSFFKSRVLLSGVLHEALAFLGRASYSIYLLHPIVYSIAKVIFKIVTTRFFELPKGALIVVAAAATLCISHFVYKYFEMTFINIGHRKKHAMS